MERPAFERRPAVLVRRQSHIDGNWVADRLGRFDLPNSGPKSKIWEDGPFQEVQMRSKAWLLAVVLMMLSVGTVVAQTRVVTGRVLDSLTNQAVTSGQVTVQGTLVSTSVEDDGTFTLAVPTRDVMLVVRSIGFKRRDVAVPVSQNSVE